jgi:hypothetical protein
MFSDNDCPNSGADSIFGNDCTEGALTMWGYCGTCWLYEESRVPKAWSERIEALLLARVEELRT